MLLTEIWLDIRSGATVLFEWALEISIVSVFLELTGMVVMGPPYFQTDCSQRSYNFSFVSLCTDLYRPIKYFVNFISQYINFGNDYSLILVLALAPKNPWGILWLKKNCRLLGYYIHTFFQHQNFFQHLYRKKIDLQQLPKIRGNRLQANTLNQNTREMYCY